MKRTNEATRFTYTDDQILQAARKIAKRLGRTPTKDELNRDPDFPTEYVIYKRWGSMRAFCKAAGLPYGRYTRSEALALSKPAAPKPGSPVARIFAGQR